MVKQSSGEWEVLKMQSNIESGVTWRKICDFIFNFSVSLSFAPAILNPHYHDAPSLHRFISLLLLLISLNCYDSIFKSIISFSYWCISSVEYCVLWYQKLLSQTWSVSHLCFYELWFLCDHVSCIHVLDELTFWLENER